jgi:hypothetical protein
MTKATNNWWDESTLRTYADFKAYFLTARNKDKGKPLNSWGRIHMDGDTIELYYGDKRGLKFAEITPDNVFTFLPSAHTARQITAVTFSQCLYRAVPFMWQRVGTGRYRVSHTSALPCHTEYNYYHQKQITGVDWGFMRTTAPEYFAGIKFDLLTGKCLNRQPDYNEQVNEDKRKVWLSSLKKFKYGLKARARIGVLDTYIEAERKVGRSGVVPDWADPQWQDLLYTSIKDNTHPPELLQGLVSQAMNTNWYQHRGNIKAASVLSTADDVCKTYSIDLRKKFGVFSVE